MINEIKKECREQKIWCIINDSMKIKGKKYNASIIINREGKIVGEYRKMNLYGDGEDFRSGKKVKVFKTDFAKIGIAICWDLAFPELFRKMKKLGTQIVFCPSQWKYELCAHEGNKYENKHKDGERALLESLIRSRAFENLFYVALINPILKDKDQVNYSAIVSPHKILAQINEKEGLITAKIDFSKLDKLHNIYNPKKII